MALVVQRIMGTTSPADVQFMVKPSAVSWPLGAMILQLGAVDMPCDLPTVQTFPAPAQLMCAIAVLEQERPPWTPAKVGNFADVGVYKWEKRATNDATPQLQQLAFATLDDTDLYGHPLRQLGVPVVQPVQGAQGSHWVPFGRIVCLNCCMFGVAASREAQGGARALLVDVVSLVGVM